MAESERSGGESFHLADYEAEQQQYRTFSGLALVALLAGLLSLSAMLSVLLIVVPIIALVLGITALVRIRFSDPPLVGRNAAWLGIFLALFSLGAGPTSYFVTRTLLEREARAYAEIWIDHLRNGEVLAAHQLTKAPGRREPLDEKLASKYTPKSVLRQSLQSFLENDGVLALIALGDKATVRYYETPAIWEDANGWHIVEMFAVTYDDPEDGKKKTFFLSITLQRLTLPTVGLSDWLVIDTEGAVCPPSLEDLRPKRDRGPAA
ncbi:MAG: hypothetical protein D6741_20545 [Planctomycetota bacterium]|nr:MAG: hypothetical protein D6741_20545 [Planctomycetota bacterium]